MVELENEWTEDLPRKRVRCECGHDVYQCGRVRGSYQSHLYPVDPPPPGSVYPGSLHLQHTIVTSYDTSPQNQSYDVFF